MTVTTTGGDGSKDAPGGAARFTDETRGAAARSLMRFRSRRRPVGVGREAGGVALAVVAGVASFRSATPRRPRRADAAIRVAELLRAYSARCCRLVLGGAMRASATCGITAKHLAAAQQSVTLLVALAEAAKERRCDDRGNDDDDDAARWGRDHRRRARLARVEQARLARRGQL